MVSDRNEHIMRRCEMKVGFGSVEPPVPRAVQEVGGDEVGP